MMLRIGVLTSIGITLDAFFPELVDEWKSAGHEVYVAAGSPSSKMEASVLHGLTRQPSLTNVRGVQSIRNWAQENRLNIILANTATASALARVRTPRTPVVYFCHGLHWDSSAKMTGRIWQGIEGFLLRNTSGVIAINSDDLRWFRSRMPLERILYLQGGVGVPLDKYPRRTLDGIDAPKLLWVGEFSDRKRPEAIVNVAIQLRNQGFKFQLTMLGDGPKFSEIQKMVNVHDLNDLVFLPGRLPVQDWIAWSHLLVHTASWEGLPRVLLEGFAMGRRAVGFDVKGVRDVPDIALVKDMQIANFAAQTKLLFDEPGSLHVNEVPSWLDNKSVAKDLRDFLALRASTGTEWG